MKNFQTRPSFEETTPPMEVPRPVPAFSLSGSLSPFLLAPMVLTVLVALFAPADILDMWPWARRFTIWVRQTLPFMPLHVHAESTTYSQVALLTHCLTLTVIPIASLIWSLQAIVNYPLLLARRHALGRLEIKHHLMVLMVMPLLMLGSVYFFMALPGDPSFSKGITTHSRIGFAFFSFAAMYGTSAVLGGQLLNIRLFIDTYLRVERKENGNR